MFNTPFQNMQTVPFKPDTQVPAFGVMYVTGITILEGQMALTTKKPDGMAVGEIIAINGPSIVDSGEYGACQLAGDIPVRVLVNSAETVANGMVCGPKSAQWTLYEDYPGFIAMAAEDADDLAWVKRFHHFHFWGVLDGDLNQGSSATVSLWWGSTLGDSTENVTAHDNLLEVGETIDATTKVKLEYFPIAQKYYVTAALCSGIS